MWTLLANERQSLDVLSEMDSRLAEAQEDKSDEDF